MLWRSIALAPAADRTDAVGMPDQPTPEPSADIRTADPASRLSTPIPDSTKKRRLRIQHAARLYIYEGIDQISDLSKKSGVAAKYLRKVRVDDDWDGFAEAVWSERTTSTLTIRTVEEQSLIDGEKERQHREVPKLQKEADRLIDELALSQPGSKIHGAILSAIKTVRGLLEGSTHYDLAKAEAAARMKLSLTQQPTTPSAHRPELPDPTTAPDLNDWEGGEETELEADAVPMPEADATADIRTAMGDAETPQPTQGETSQIGGERARAATTSSAFQAVAEVLGRAEGG